MKSLRLPTIEIHMLAYMMSIICLLCMCSPALADNPEYILATLRQGDKALLQGTIRFDETYVDPTFPTGGFTASHELYYSADGRYHWKTNKYTGNKMTSVEEDIFDGKEQFSVVSVQGKDRRPSVNFGFPLHRGGLEGMWALTNGPCFALGRGLSFLKDAVVTIDATGVHLVGTANGTKIEALLDAGHGYVAKNIFRKINNGKTISTWQLDKPQRYGGGVFIASVSNFTTNSGIRRHYVIHQAQFSKPSSEMLTFDWHQPGLQIEDTRLSSSDAGIFKSEDLPSNITSSQLLEMTREQITARAKLHATNDAAKEAYRRQSIIRLSVFFIVIIAALIAFVVKREHSK